MSPAMIQRTEANRPQYIDLDNENPRQFMEQWFGFQAGISVMAPWAKIEIISRREREQYGKKVCTVEWQLVEKQ